jgi:hypothetical protein
MPTVDELVECARTMACSDYDDRINRLVAAAEGDTKALTAAAMSLATKYPKAGTPDHVAFTYLNAAFNRMTESRSSKPVADE